MNSADEVGPLRQTEAVLPVLAVTSDGQSFDPSQNNWRFKHPSGGIVIRLKEFAGFFNARLQLSLRLVLLARLRHSSSSTVRLNVAGLLKAMRDAKAVGENSIRLEHLLPLNGYALHAVKPLLCYWAQSGVPGVEAEAAAWLRKQRAEDCAYRSVLTWDPESGPLSDVEYRLVALQLRRGLEQRLIDPEEYLLIILLMITGSRPTQVALLRCSDANGRQLWMPRIKNRKITRTEGKVWSLQQSIAELLAAHVDKRLAANIGRPAEDVSLFRWTTGGVITVQCRLIGKCLGLLREDGKPLRLAPMRLRHTLGTRAAEEGHGEFIVAALLDHADTQSVKAYLNVRTSQAVRITEATSLHLGPLAQAFAGTIIDSEALGIRGDDVTSRVSAPVVGNLGTCGYHGPCSELAPVACYTCGNFQPWRDAPHSELYDLLLAERDRALKATSDPRYVQVQDLSLRAIAQVVTLCRSDEATSPPTDP